MSTGNESLLAIIGGTIIDGVGGAPIKEGVIVVDGQRITSVGDHATPLPAHAKHISAAGKFIVPGLIGESTVLVGDTGVGTLVRFEGRYDELALEAAQVALKSGLTTVIDSWGPRDDLIKVRTAINEGRAVGPRIYLSGGWIGCDGPLSADSSNNYREALWGDIADRINARWECNVGGALTGMSPAQVREEVRKYIETGVDFLNVPINPPRYGVATQFFHFSPRVLRAIVEEAHRTGLLVRGVCPGAIEAVWVAIEAGVDLPAKAMSTPFPAELVELLARRQIPLLINPSTQAEMEWYRQRMKDLDFSKVGPLGSHNDAWTAIHREIAQEKPRNEQAVLRAGVPVMFYMGGFMASEDSRKFFARIAHNPPGDFGVLGKQHFNVLMGAQDIRMKPMEALQAATRNIAKAYKVDKDLGTLEQGKFADLLVLDRDPLENAENYRAISVVMKGGQVIDRDALPTQRLLTRAPSRDGPGCSSGILKPAGAPPLVVDK
jgi:imidazolonepropionase-like amidohydrolase